MQPVHQLPISRKKRVEVVSKQSTKVTAISSRLEWRIEQVYILLIFFSFHRLI
jgi:hypothetical protein